MNKALALLLVSVPLAACNINDGDRFSLGACPDGETCSDHTPEGLQFQGASVEGVSGVAKTAVGGTQSIVLIRPDLNGQEQPFPYTTDDDGGAAVHVTGHEEAHVHVAGVAPGENMLRILDPESNGALMDRTTLGAANVGSVQLASGQLEPVPPDAVDPVAFQGVRFVEVALRAEHTNERMVDESLTIPGFAQTDWQHVDLHATPVGPLALTLTLGSGEQHVLSTAIVDHVDAIALQPISFDDPSTMLTEVPPHTSSFLCFSPTMANGAFVLGAPIRYSVSANGMVDDQPNKVISNCTSLTVTGGSSVQVTASLGAVSTTITLHVEQGGAKVRARPLAPPAGFVAGERAALLAE